MGFTDSLRMEGKRKTFFFFSSALTASDVSSLCTKSRVSQKRGSQLGLLRCLVVRFVFKLCCVASS